ncbi:MAG: hypothetical protein WC841_03790 [Candidatus Shapirobacteria bacterium]|jgi:guanylate kinase
MNRTPEGHLLIITGPSGVGKDAVVDGFRRRNPEYKFLVTSTTRPPRRDSSGNLTEVDGIDYFFETRDQFLQGIEEGDFVEYAQYYGDRKGLRRSQIEQVANGGNMILRVDPVAAANYGAMLEKHAPDLAKVIIPRMTKVFIGTPDLWTLMRRRAARDQGGRRQLIDRLRVDWETWMSVRGEYIDQMVINYDGKLEETVHFVEAIIARKINK